MTTEYIRPVEHCDSMADVRRNIDALDTELVDMLALRGAYVAQAARIKNNPDLVVDEERIEFIIDRVKTLSDSAGLEPDVAERTWRAMIAAYIDFEMAHVKRLQQAQEDTQQK